MTWLQEFFVETLTPPNSPEILIDAALSSERLWLWQNGSVLSMAIGSKPIQGVVRVTAVYTPLETRRHGYAAACVHGVSKHLNDMGYRCMLYTDLGNPTSNSIYRRIGYRCAVAVNSRRFRSGLSRIVFCFCS